MQIFIPSSGRSKDQASYKRLSAIGLMPIIVVPQKEVSEYAALYPNVLGVPDELKIAGTRQWIVDNATDKNVVMVDDDLAFFHRRSDEPTKLRDITDAELFEAFQSIESHLCDGTPLVGFAAREGANRNTDPLVWNTRILRVLAYHVPTLKKFSIRFDEITVMEDFNVALRIHETGRSSLVLNTYAHNQTGGSNAPGGCSQYRTMALQAAAALQLRRLHPQWVKVVEKQTKTAWNGQLRTDVTIFWKKCHDQSPYLP